MTNAYTVEFYKFDRRTKNGEKLFSKFDFTNISRGELVKFFDATVDPTKFRYEIHETFVTRHSSMDGREFQERYDTPYHCSPSSESYWAS
jgi:hypothetical protein